MTHQFIIILTYSDIDYSDILLNLKNYFETVLCMFLYEFLKILEKSGDCFSSKTLQHTAKKFPLTNSLVNLNKSAGNFDILV